MRIRTALLILMSTNLILILLFLVKSSPSVSGFFWPWNNLASRLLKSDVALVVDLAVLLAIIFWIVVSRKSN